jgi:hypothetical protein
MKAYFAKLRQSRMFWFIAGVLLMPIFHYARGWVYPTAKQAMGFTGFYEEEISLYTFLGDHSYHLAFPGEQADFERFVHRMGLKEKISDTEYREQGERWKRSATFTPADKLRSIRYESSSH